MADDAPLLPPASVIHERLARNHRERHLLRTLLKLSIRETEERQHHGPREPRRTAAGRGVGE